MFPINFFHWNKNMILQLTTYFNGIVYYHLVLLLYQQFEVFICYLSKYVIVRWVSKTPLKLPHNKLNKRMNRTQYKPPRQYSPCLLILYDFNTRTRI